MLMAYFSCAGGGGEASRIAARALKSHGGDRAAGMLENYVGRGFMKALPVGREVRNYPLDIFIEGKAYKETMTFVSKGKPRARWVWISDGERTTKWSSEDRWLNNPDIEYDFLKYRYPRILGWLGDTPAGGEVIERSEEAYRLEFTEGNDTVRISLYPGRWLLKSVEVENSARSLTYREEYEDYRDVDGIMIPNRARRSINGNAYCEAFTPSIEYGKTIPDSVFTILPEDTLIVQPE